MKFDTLPIQAKRIIIEEFGELISSLEHEQEVAELYLLNDFYVEVLYRGVNAYKIEKVSSSQRLIPYCPTLDL